MASRSKALAALCERADACDRDDSLAPLRAEFLFPQGPGGDVAYLCGNSLGLQPRATRAALQGELDDWQRLGVEGHFHARNPWYSYHEPLAAPLGRLLGASPLEVVAMGSLTSTLHALLISFYRPSGRRTKIAMEEAAFPSDRYALASHLRLHGQDPDAAALVLRPRPGEAQLRTEDVLATLRRHGDEVALIMLGAVHYYTGQLHDMKAITAAGHAIGACVGWDLAHAAGNVELQLHDWGVDFAVGCSYKYLNSGPGSVGIAFVHDRHARAPELPRLAGWWGNDAATRFAMPESFQPAAGAVGWQQSNAPVFAMAPLRVSLEVFDRATMPALRRKSLALTGLLAEGLQLLLDAHPGAFEILTPADPAARGAQLSLLLPGRAAGLAAALQAAGVVADLRRPDVIRVAPAPLYCRFADVARALQVVADFLAAEGR